MVAKEKICIYDERRGARERKEQAARLGLNKT